MKQDKKMLIISTIVIVLLIGIMVGATYAYFKAQTGGAGNVPTQVTTNTTDSLVFEVGADISIIADTTTFAEGMDNRTGESFARATLKANNKTNSASGNYYVYFDVTKNELSYTTSDKKPELLLKITKTLGNNNSEEVTSGIEGVEYKTVTDGKGNQVSGFDITEYSGLLTIAYNYEIISTGEEVHNWNIEVILVNLNDNQTANGGKTLVSKLIIQKEKLPTTIAEACQDKELGSCIAENYKLDENIYYHKNLENSTEDDSYRYSGSYESVNNYVCFGTDGTVCDNDHLYRIIGVFNNQVKLIKADFATEKQLGTTEKGGEWTENFIKNSYPNYKGKLTIMSIYYWSGSVDNKVNIWANSTLNTNALNTNFLASFSTLWQNKIAITNWKVGGNTFASIAQTNAKTAYTNEIINPVSGQPAVNNKIGLMYVSDYMYGARPIYWLYKGLGTQANDYRAATGANWMYSGVNECTITRRTDNSTGGGIFSLESAGYVNNPDVSTRYYCAIRPVFYLNSEVKLTSGEGTPTNPYRIN